MRKPSAETQLRRTRRELNELKQIRDALILELDARSRIGQQMSNVCYNLGHENSTEGQKLGAHVQILLRGLRENWDAIRRQL